MPEIRWKEAFVTRFEFPESLPDFQRLFPYETHCSAYLESVRWPDGFICPHCGQHGDPYRFKLKKELPVCDVTYDEQAVHVSWKVVP